MALVPPVFVSGSVISADDVNTWNTQLAAVLNGGITTANMSASAGVLSSQLAASYEHLAISLRYGTGSAIPTAWPAAGRVDHQCVPGTTADAAGDWIVDQVEWLCTDTGDATGTGAFSILWGGWTGNPLAWNLVSTPLGSTVMTNGAGAGAQSANTGIVTAGFPATLTRQAYPCFLALNATAAGANLLSAATDQIVVTVKLHRAISAT